MKTLRDIQGLERGAMHLTLPRAPIPKKPTFKAWKPRPEQTVPVPPADGHANDLPIIGKKQKEIHGTSTRLSIQSP
jgi:hypothetical protein